MFETIATYYVQVFAVILPALVIGLIAIGAHRSGLSKAKTVAAIGGIAALLGVWHALSVNLAKAGILMPPLQATDPPYALMPLLGGAFLLWALGRWTDTGRTILGGLDHIHLISIQSLRLMGGFFLIGWVMGDIPWQFALPAGIGDIMAGIAAIQAVRALDRGDANAEHLVRRASIIGLLDFVVAVSLGIVTSVGFMQLMAFDSPNIINAYPLALFPEYFVPIFIAFQLFSLGALRRRSGQIATA
ncbi:hypothetical protein DL239_00880 [Sedimentitalea sp. CY04]|uniref:Lycopene cyclase domain-containing protein n=1 Tax=Parasedimentitalea denitrificans TaxID=2211118 RepID=A0ABX0W401_9RHOB|nr:hypothetical protein [Sedimentitalea sp. CY04]NIZ59524.1 hypothetical protein [Sedimentitalea sp. CY04]